MKNGIARFEFYLKQVEQLLTSAQNEKDPGKWLYENNIRTQFFMLEALSKLYSNLHNKQSFNKLKEWFKIQEDQLGAVDHYDEILKNYPVLSTEVATDLSIKKEQALKKLNELLIEEGWMGKKPRRLEKIRKRISEAEWLDEKEEIDELKTFYRNEIVEINVFYQSAGNPFTDMENEVHEIRRKLRWLSIYAQALRGAIQLVETIPPTEEIKKYLIPEITNSPFNILPDKQNVKHLLLFEKNYFLALSWLIAELGKIKDQGLQLLTIEGESHVSNTKLQSLLSEATRICREYFHEHNLEKLIVGVSTVNSI